MCFATDSDTGDEITNYAVCRDFVSKTAWLAKCTANTALGVHETHRRHNDEARDVVFFGGGNAVGSVC